MNNIPKPFLMILEDELATRKRMESLLSDIGFQVESFAFFDSAVAALSAKKYDAFVVDLNLPGGHNGIEFLKIALETSNAAVAIVSAHLDDSWGSQLSKFFFERSSRLYCQLNKHGYEPPLKEWAHGVLSYVYEQYSAESAGYHSEDFRVKTLVDDVIPIVARSGQPVLIVGESGTGKEDLARLIHMNPYNPFRSGPFIAVNCAAISDELILSDLFGHVMGAFTGAFEYRLGWFLEASGWKHESSSARNYREKVLDLILKRLGVKDLTSLYQKVILTNDFKDQKKKIDECLRDINELVKKFSGVRAYITWLEKCGNNVGYAKKGLVDEGNRVNLMGNSYGEAREEGAEYLYVQNANPGTLFLDEIGDLSPAAEVALLRALDGYGIRPLGYTGPALLPSCRVIAATNRLRSRADVREPYESLQGRGHMMRKDLYWRLACWVLELPPLRERRGADGQYEWVASLRKWAARDGFQFGENDLEEFAQKLIAHGRNRLWDGNWRELRHVYARAKTTAEMQAGNRIIRMKDLDFALQWVLVEEYQAQDENHSKVDLVPSSAIGNSRRIHGGSLNPEVEERLDSILSIRYILNSCDLKKINAGQLKMVIEEANFGSLGLCEQVKKKVCDIDLVFRAVSKCIHGDRVVSAAVDTLMGRESHAALKNWWKNNAEAVIGVVNIKIDRYGIIVTDLQRMSRIFLSAPFITGSRGE